VGHPALSSILSSLVAPAVGFVIMTELVVDGAERLQDVELLAASDVFLQRGSHIVVVGRMAADAAGFLEQFVVNVEVDCSA